MLDVYVNNLLAGSLEQKDANLFVFTYADTATISEQISLLMPISKKEWVSRSLHPVFQVSLPEGALRELISSQFSKAFKVFTDIELLSLIGRHLIGRISVTPHGLSPVAKSPIEDIGKLIDMPNTEILSVYLDRYARYSGVSGGFEKFLVEAKDRNTIVSDKWIIKCSDVNHPNIALNEFFGMAVASKLGLPVPDVILSKDGLRFAVKRFDIDRKNGSKHGFEDMCALMGFGSTSMKFSGSIERMIDIVKTFCGVNAKESLKRLYAQILLSSVIRNGDAHLKNFGLVYDNVDNASLSPVYDMLTMSAYAPKSQTGDTLDQPALMMSGKRAWLNEKTAYMLAKQCEISDAVREEVSKSLVIAIMETVQDLLARAEADVNFMDTGCRIAELWGHGVSWLDQTAAKEVGFSVQKLRGSRLVGKRDLE